MTFSLPGSQASSCLTELLHLGTVHSVDELNICRQFRCPSAGFTFCSGEPRQFRSRTAANALSPNPARPCRLAVSRPCAPLMSGWRVDTPSAAARLARSRPPSRGRRAGREGHLASVSRAPDACRSSPRRTRREAATATSSSWARASSGASCARGGSTYVRDARRALGLGFFPRA